MVWLKKVILFILSVLFITLISCDSFRSKSESPQKEKISEKELVDLFLKETQNWSVQSIPLIDSIGFKISAIDSFLTFLPYANDYEQNSFVFIAKKKNAFHFFEESDFLFQSKFYKQSSYKVWRQEINNLKVLDFSIEPHPTLDWLFVIRLRSQE